MVVVITGCQALLLWFLDVHLHPDEVVLFHIFCLSYFLVLHPMQRWRTWAWANWGKPHPNFSYHRRTRLPAAPTLQRPLLAALWLPLLFGSFHVPKNDGITLCQTVAFSQKTTFPWLHFSGQRNSLRHWPPAAVELANSIFKKFLAENCFPFDVCGAALRVFG